MLSMFSKSCSCDFSSCLIAGRDVRPSERTVRFHICQTQITAKQEKNPIGKTWKLQSLDFKFSKIFCDFPWFRESGNSPGDLPEPDGIEHFEEWSRREAKRLYKELHPEKEVPDEDFFINRELIEVPAGRDVQQNTFSTHPEFHDLGGGVWAAKALTEL